jgi:simple sugar transport system permease protein
VRAVGENPQAADVSGIDVNKRRRESIYYGGLLAGLGGAFLVLGQVGSFDTGAVGGRGFIAIAAVYFGGWRLGGVMLGSFLFGLADAFRLAVPVLGYQLNAQLLAALPYVLTLAVMYFITKQFRQPAALSQPFIRGLR